MYTITKQIKFVSLFSILSLFQLSIVVAESGYGGPYGFGSPADPKLIKKWDIDVMPDGRGAPPGKGSYKEGKTAYLQNCAACHGIDMSKPTKGTGAAALRGGRGSLASGKPNKTVESYWPYASTVFDYVKRAMPFHAPGSLTDDQYYAVTMYILAQGNIISKDTVLSAENIGKIKMPNRNGFIWHEGGGGHRPDVHNFD